MELTAERLEAPTRSLPWKAVGIALAPLILVIAYLSQYGDVLLAEPEEVFNEEYYPAVAVVFVSTAAEGRYLEMAGTVEAERTVALRVERDSMIISIDARIGQKVRAGQPVCRVRPMGSQEIQVLFSPIDGTVMAHGAEKGRVLGRGTGCATITDPSSMMVLSEFSQRYAEVVQPGDWAEITIGEVSAASEIRIIYPMMDPTSEDPRPFEVDIPEGVVAKPGDPVTIKITTDQIIPTLVPFRALVLDPELGMAARIVTGDGPSGIVRTVPVTLVATGEEGFYVEGLPIEARLIVKDPAFPQPPEGERVRIGRVG